MNAVSLSSRFLGTMLGGAVGDALGAPFEGGSPLPIDQLRSLLTATPELIYTDDTHMAIGLADSLIKQRGFDGQHMALLFAENYLREPWRGYGPGPPRIFQRMIEGAAWDTPAVELFGGIGSFGNGAAMRVAPVALHAYGDIERVAYLARQTARITHAHELGVEGAVLQACAVALMLTSDPDQPIRYADFQASLRKYVHAAPYHSALKTVERILPDATPAKVAKEIGNDITALAAVPAALCCFFRHRDSFADAVLFAIAVGGDTDTIASMTGALSGARLGDAAVPPIWRNKIESRERLSELAMQLLSTATGGGPAQ